MSEQKANIGSRYSVRLSDLCSQHILTALCGACTHRSFMRLWQSTAGRQAHTYLTDIEGKLRCQKCGNRAGNRIFVTIGEDD